MLWLGTLHSHYSDIIHEGSGRWIFLLKTIFSSYINGRFKSNNYDNFSSDLVGAQPIFSQHACSLISGVQEPIGETNLRSTCLLLGYSDIALSKYLVDVCQRLYVSWVSGYFAGDICMFYLTINFSMSRLLKSIGFTCTRFSSETRIQ